MHYFVRQSKGALLTWWSMPQTCSPKGCRFEPWLRQEGQPAQNISQIYHLSLLTVATPAGRSNWRETPFLDQMFT